MQQHPGPGKPHYLTYLFPHLRLVAVHFTVTAECLFLHKRTLIAALPRIVRELLTVRAHPSYTPVISLMVLPAVQTDHLLHHILLFLPLLLYLTGLLVATHSSSPPHPEGTPARRGQCGSS